MLAAEVLKKIRKINLRVRRKVAGPLAGSWNSAFQGRGIEFSEVRPYQSGDDVRAIDWNVTARAGEPYIKRFREERELAVHLLVDVSPSLGFGTRDQTKLEVVTELVATLAYAALANQDRVGMCLFTDQVERRIPPRRGHRQVIRLVSEMLSCQPQGRETRFAPALLDWIRTTRRRALVFLISDFQAPDWEDAIRLPARRHELIPVVVHDEFEQQWPDLGLIQLQDNETGQRVWVDTSDSLTRRRYFDQVQEQREQFRAICRESKLLPLELWTGSDLGPTLDHYFLQREARFR